MASVSQLPKLPRAPGRAKALGDSFTALNSMPIVVERVATRWTGEGDHWCDATIFFGTRPSV